MSRIKIEDNNKDNRFIIMAKLLSDREDSQEIIDNALKNGNGKELIFDIDLKINGLEFDFGSFIDKLIDNIDEYVDYRAKELLKNKLVDVDNKVNDILNNLDDISSFFDFV